MILRRNDPFAQVVVPDHPELDRGTLRAILRQANVEVTTTLKSVREFPGWGIAGANSLIRRLQRTVPRRAVSDQRR